MATNLLDRVPVERVRAEADRIHLGRLLLTVLVAVLFTVGWVAGKASLGVRWSLAAVKVGWQDARATGGRRPHGVPS